MNDTNKSELFLYLLGAALSAGLTGLAFWAVMGLSLERSSALMVIGLCAVAQVVVQLRCFLHIRFTGQTREDLQLILFSLMLLSIMAGGTIWIMSDLASRMH